MKHLVLSTMYAQQERFEDGAAFARYAAGAGYNGIEISHSTDARKLQEIADAGSLPVVSVHAPAPRSKGNDGRWNSRFNLASPDRDERRLAVAHTKESISWAHRLGAGYVIVHLGQVGESDEQFQEEREMRRLFDSGHREDGRFLVLQNAAMARRRASCERYLDAARSSLLELVAFAGSLRVTIGIENRYHFHEIPLPGEYHALLEGLDLGEAGYWHDTGHAEVLHRLGFVDRLSWLSTLSSRCVGAHLHDVLGIGDHRAPGDGDVEWDYIVKGVGHLDSYTLEINQHQSDQLVSQAIQFLRSIQLG